jgi:hypothetical protein
MPRPFLRPVWRGMSASDSGLLGRRTGCVAQPSPAAPRFANRNCRCGVHQINCEQTVVGGLRFRQEELCLNWLIICLT